MNYKILLGIITFILILAFVIYKTYENYKNDIEVLNEYNSRKWDGE